jgi:D-alanyl-lipoteichoic acid acyltransferase DltB (MBOAT superfamily)
MGFATFKFWALFGTFFPVYWTALNFKSRIKWRNLSLLVVSYLFYASWDWRFLAIIFTSSVLDFLVGLQLEREREQPKRMFLLVSSITLNVGFLALFKYHNFFIDAADSILGLFAPVSLNRVNWVLPVGISFYTFQTISYTIDVYRGTIKPERDPITFLTYVAFFPQLLAGPIERAKTLMPQFHRAHRFELDAMKKAFLRILWGAFKKVVIADRLAIFVNHAYAQPEELTALTAITAILFFVFQLYCDFSGYCDMAIGMARLLGFELSENFRRPLLAGNIRSVYQRWHITIHNWFKDYVYLSLPIRKNNLQRGLNVLLVFALAGLWHGSGMNFLFWGLLNGLLIFLLDPVIDAAHRSASIILSIVSKGIGHLSVYLSLVFFRAETLQEAAVVFRSFLKWNYSDLAAIPEQFAQFGLHMNELIVAILLILIVLLVEYIQEYSLAAHRRFYQGHGLFRWSSAMLLSLGIVLLGFYDGREGAGTAAGDKHQEEFIYEQF